MQSQKEEPYFKRDLVSFFSKHPTLLQQIFEEAKEGKVQENFIKEVFAEAQELYDDPDRGIKAIIDLRIPFNRYREFASFNQFHDKDENIWGPKKVRGVPLPRTWPSFKKVTKRWKKLKRSFGIRSIPNLAFNASYWRIDKWLEYVITSPFYKAFIEKPEELEVIIRGDGFLAGKDPCTFLLATLGNFGIFSKCVIFNFVLNFAMAGEKDVEKLREAFEYVISFFCYIVFVVRESEK